MTDLISFGQQQQNKDENNIWLSNGKPKFAVPTCDDGLLWETWMSMLHFPTLTVADELGLFPLIAEAPKTASQISESLSLSERASEALLGVMTSLGYLVQQNGKFNLTKVSRNFLLPDSPYYWGGMLKLMANNPLSHSVLLEALTNDRSSVYQEQDVWEAHEVEVEKAKLFTGAMQSMTMPGALGVAYHGNFSGVKRLLDVGGGFCCCFCCSSPTLSPNAMYDFGSTSSMRYCSKLYFQRWILKSNRYVFCKLFYGCLSY